MAKKKQFVVDVNDVPETLENHPFYGLELDDEQRKLVNAVWKRDKKLYLVNSIAGSGKTLMAVALGTLMVKYNLYEKVVYVTFPGIHEKTQGFLPGDLLQKSAPYFQPLYDALLTINELPDHVCNTSITAVECGTAFVECAVSTYMRGINLNNAFVIIDEAENADLPTLAKVISRINDNCIAMVIGHSGQCDMYDKTKSGFVACIDYQTKYHPEICEEFKLSTNHRGWISQYADLMLQEYQNPQYGFIYMTKNLITGKLYIGQHKRTMNPKDIDDSWYLGSGVALRRAILKYGEENFERTILYECENESQLNYMEYVFTDFYNVVEDDNFYNMVMGGQGPKCHTFTEEQKEHMRHPHKPMSPETREHRRMLDSKRVCSEETRRKLSELAKAKLTGYKHSEQSKHNMSESHKGSRPMCKNGIYKYIRPNLIEEYLNEGWILEAPKRTVRRIQCTNIITNDTTVYRSKREIAKALNVSTTQIDNYLGAESLLQDTYKITYADELD
jgi:group I intron endonuclease